MAHQAPWRVAGDWRRQQQMAATHGDGLRAQHETRAHFEPADFFDRGRAVLRDAQASSDDAEVHMNGRAWKPDNAA
jgi:hypothetical protein